MTERDTPLAGLERWRSTLFLLGGALVVAFAIIEGYGVAVAGDPAHMDNLRGVFLAGYVLGFVGLVGFYPALVGRSPWLSRLGAGCAALGALGFSVASVLSLGRLAGVAPPREAMPAWVGLFGVLPLLGFLLGYLAIGVGSLRTDDQPPRLGLLLLAPTGVFVLLIASSGVGLPPWTVPVLAGGNALALLGIGYVLRTEDSLSIPSDSAG